MDLTDKAEYHTSSLQTQNLQLGSPDPGPHAAN